MPDRTLELPLFNRPVSVVGFFRMAPLLLVSLHAYFLLERLRLALGLRQAWPPERARADLDQGRNSPVFVPLFLFRDPLLKRSPKLRALLLAMFVILTLLPLAVLVLIGWSYLPAHDPVGTLWHQILILVDLALISAGYLVTHELVQSGSDPAHRRRMWSRVGVLGLTVIALTVMVPGCSRDRGQRFPLELEAWEPVRPDAGSRRLRLRLQNLANANLRGASLSGLDLSETNLAGADLRNTDLRDANLRGATLAEARLGGADLTGADLRKADLRRVQAAGANFTGARLDRANLEGASLRHANLFAADLTHARLTAADLFQADLRLSDLRGTWLRAARLVEARLDAARMGSPFPLSTGLDLRGSYLRWAQGLPERMADLRRAHLAGASLDQVALNRTLMAGAQLEMLQEGQIWQLRRELESRLLELSEQSGERWSRGHLVDPAVLRRARLQAAWVGSPAQAPADVVLPDRDLTAIFHAEVASDLVAAACHKEVLADFVIDKAAGDLLPADVPGERALAAELLSPDRETCPALDRRRREVRRRVCAPDRMVDICEQAPGTP
jgi:uncharacterized protein YjbI with pentapeptide repeats